MNSKTGFDLSTLECPDAKFCYTLTFLNILRLYTDYVSVEDRIRCDHLKWNKVKKSARLYLYADGTGMFASYVR